MSIGTVAPVKRLWWVVVLGLVAASFAACGDDEDASDEAATDEVATDDDDGEAEAEPDEADAQAAVDASVAAFVAELEAAGFVAEAEEEDDEPFEFTSEECKAFDEAFPDDGEDLPGQAADAESGSYQRSSDDPLDGGAFAEGSAAVVEDDDEVDAVFELLADDRLATCMREAFQQGIDESAAEDPSAPAPEIVLDVARAEPLEGMDDAVALAMTGSMGVAGFSFDIDGTLQLVRRGDRVAMFLGLAFGGPLDIDVAGLVDALLGVEAA